MGSRNPFSICRIALACATASFAVGCSSTPKHPVEAMPTIVVQEEEPPKVDAMNPNSSFGDRRIPRSREVQPGWAAEGLWVGARFTETGPLGNWNGNLVLTGPTDAVIVPDLEPDEGYGFSVSYRWRAWEALLTYDNTEHDGDFSGSALSHDTEIENLDLNLRRYYGVMGPLQPYFLVGLGWSRAEIENGTTDGALTFAVVQDAKLEDGVNVNLGAGLAFYPLPWISVYGQAMYRFVEYYSSEGLDGSFNSMVDGDNWQLAAGASIRLLPSRKSW